MKKKILSFVLTAAMAVSLVACGSATTSSSESDTSASGDSASSSASSGEILENGRYASLTVAAATDLGDLEPTSVNKDPRYYMIYNIYETLFDFADDSSGELVGVMAESYEEVSDTQWLVTLHDDIYDWEGNNITSSDVAYSFQWLIDGGNELRYDYFDSIEVIDDYTFYINWTAALPALSEAEFPLTRTIVFSQAAYEEKGNFATTPVGTGHYQVTEFTIGSRVVMEADDDWWGTPYEDQMEARHQANVQTLTFETITEASTAVVALETGTIDVCGYVPLSMMDEFESGQYSDQYSVETLTSGDFWYFAPNINNVNEDLRKALYYALDGDAIATAMGGSYVAMDSFGTTYYTDWDDSLILSDTYVDTCDTDTAQEYLDTSGYNGETLKIICLSSEEAKAAAQMAQVQLQAIGVNTEINAVNQDTYESTVIPSGSDEWDIAIASLGGSNMVGAWHLLFDNEVNDGVTTTNIDDDQLQELYEASKADATHDAEHMRACLDYVIEKGYAYPLVSISNALVYNSDISEIHYREGYYYPAAFSFSVD
ncbi:MAG: ABC transporter substrate-binding protein [Clostridiales bacterium]|nr:ABC transporter substrate-binding protein [Clostridiales bacterium]